MKCSLSEATDFVVFDLKCVLKFKVVFKTLTAHLQSMVEQQRVFNSARRALLKLLAATAEVTCIIFQQCSSLVLALRKWS